jgi:hypothetical protein
LIHGGKRSVKGFIQLRLAASYFVGRIGLAARRLRLSCIDALLVIRQHVPVLIIEVISFFLTEHAHNSVVAPVSLAVRCVSITGEPIEV